MKEEKKHPTPLKAPAPGSKPVHTAPQQPASKPAQPKSAPPTPKR